MLSTTTSRCFSQNTHVQYSEFRHSILVNPSLQIGCTKPIWYFFSELSHFWPRTVHSTQRVHRGINHSFVNVAHSADKPFQDGVVLPRFQHYTAGLKNVWGRRNRELECKKKQSGSHLAPLGFTLEVCWREGGVFFFQ